MAAMARAEPVRSQELFRVSHTDARSQGFGPSSTAFPGHNQGAGWEVEQLIYEPMPIWDPGTCKADFSSLAIALGSVYSF